MLRGAKSRMRRTETPKPIWIKFCVVVDIADVVKYANFGDHRLRGFWVAGGQISPSPIDFHRRPYNTLALPCERVISIRYRPGGGETVCPRQWQFDGGISFRRQPGHRGSKNRGGSTSVCGWVRSPHISGSRRWLSCRQPVCR